MRCVLAVLEEAASAPAVLAGADGMAAALGGARITVLAPRTPPEAAILPTEEVLTRGGAAALRAAESARVGGLADAFAGWAARPGAARAQVAWHDPEHLPEAAVAEWGRRADVVVLARGEAPDRLVLHAALFGTDRPVLLMPPGPAGGFGRRVAVAWRDDPRTVRAVLWALPLLAAAETVHVVAGTRGAAPPFPAVLAEHGVAAEMRVCPGAGGFGATLLEQARAVGADLLVMGAYTHSAWRERLLGGVTRHVLARAAIPVLLRH
jgi:nucleotide-binding universal stress UspA family protein